MVCRCRLALAWRIRQTSTQRHLKNHQPPVVPRMPDNLQRSLWQWNLLPMDVLSFCRTATAAEYLALQQQNARRQRNHHAGCGLPTRRSLGRQESGAGADPFSGTGQEMRGSDFSPGVTNSAYRSKLAQRLGGYEQESDTLPQRHPLLARHSARSITQRIMWCPAPCYGAYH